VPAVILVRHGQASFGEADYDRLSTRGVQQAHVVAEQLLRQGARVELALSGALGRQRATAEPIAAALGRDLELDSRWDEYDSDDILAHHSTSAVRQDRPPGNNAPEVSSREFQAVLERAVLDWIAAGGAGPAAESWPRFSQRVGAALTEVGRRLSSGQTALVCTSGGVLAALCTQILAVPDPTFVTFNRVTVNAGISRVLIGRSGATLLSFNEQAHLLSGGTSLVTYR
jgi:broad specificity phosphatase PhoE